MRKIFLFGLLALFCFLSTSVYARSMEEDRAMCLTLNALARSQCKEPADYSYEGIRQGNIYVYNGFYGAKYTDFFCKIEQGEIRIMSRNKHFRRSIKFYIDENECGIIEYSPASCNDRRVIKCCFPKSEKELKQDREAEFWQRSIPDLLKEDQKKALKALQNRTVKSSETKQEGQPKE
ncbi:hypothetical protein [Maridesulfovibrio sp.]|uniref:hypothetical protein n=1 Tax=Maridesulfovibrio sp. TaxID=2795000 RepID=UPI002A18A871|nr:hypothetical protein [Maridesulfovibrio sp.]